MRAPPAAFTLPNMTALDTVTETPLGGPSLVQERRLVTSIPGPRSQELLDRKAAAVAAGVGHTAPVHAVAAGGGVIAPQAPVQERGLELVVAIARPLDATEGLDSCVRHAGVHR